MRKNTLMICCVILFVISFFTLRIISHSYTVNVIKSNPVLKNVFYLILIMCMISLVVILILMSTYGLFAALTSNLVYYTYILCMLVSTKLFSDSRMNFIQTKVAVIMVACFYALILINLLIISYQISKKDRPKPLEINEGNVKYKNIVNAINSIDGQLYKFNIILVPLLYVILVIFIIFMFALIYECYNINGSISNGFIYNNSSFSNVTQVIDSWDLLYFSSTTFFTVGYGDVIAVGNNLKFIVQIEMLRSYILGIVYLPILFILFGSRLTEKKVNRSDEKKELKTMVDKSMKEKKSKRINLNYGKIISLARWMLVVIFLVSIGVISNGGTKVFETESIIVGLALSQVLAFVIHYIASIASDYRLNYCEKVSNKQSLSLIAMTVLIIISPDYFWAYIYKRKLPKAHKALLIKYSNYLNLISSILISLFLLLTKFNNGKGIFAAFILIRLISRMFEITYAFYNDIIDKGAKTSSLYPNEGVSLAIHSFFEIILLYACIYYLFFKYDDSNYLNSLIYSASVSSFNFGFTESDCISLKLTSITQVFGSMNLVVLSIANYLGEKK